MARFTKLITALSYIIIFNFSFPFSIDARTTNDQDVFVHVALGSPDYTEFVIDNEIHRIKIGAPTRELWIDGKWYNLFFDGEPIQINIANRTRDVFFEKLAEFPNVDIGIVARKDLCLGKFYYLSSIT